MYGHARSQGSAGSSGSRGAMAVVSNNAGAAGHGSGPAYSGSNLKVGQHMYSNGNSNGFSYSQQHAQHINGPPAHAYQQHYGYGHQGSAAGSMANSSSQGFPGIGVTGPNGRNGALSSPSGSNAAGGSSGALRTRSRRPDPTEIRRVARIHYEELLKFLRSHLAKGQRGPRTNAREKLTRLSQQQFTELSTDVYDELMRRINNSRGTEEVPHLAVRDEFHPKRNQARQKLATLPRTRFKDLSSDVFFELERRFPELRAEFRPEAPTIEEELEAEQREAQQREAAQRRVAMPSPQPKAVAPELVAALQGEETADEYEGQRQNSALSAAADRPSPDRSRNAASPAPLAVTSNERDMAKPSTTDVVVPTKSSLVEEAIDMPIATTHERPSSDDGDLDAPSADAPSDLRRQSIRDSMLTNGETDMARSTMYSQASSLGTNFLSGYTNGRARNDSLSSPNPNARNSFVSAQTSEAHAAEIEKIRSEYEFKIATIQQKMTAAETRAEELERQASLSTGEIAKLRESHEHELQAARDESEQQTSSLTAELEQSKSQLSELHARHAALEEAQSTAERQSTDEAEGLRKDFSEQGELVSELRGEVSGLVEELRQLSERNDQLLGEKESLEQVVRDLNNQVASYKRRYEASKTELRSLKATSQLVLPQQKAEDDEIAADNGAIADVSLTAFQSSIDDLLSAARAKNVGNILTVYRTVVLSTTLIMEDLGKYERESTSVGAQDHDQLVGSKSKISTALNNLMISCRNHAAGGGLSPVGLVDAAASHVSAAVVETAKIFKVRKATEAERSEFEVSFLQNGTLPNGLKPLHSNAFPGPAGSEPRRRGTELSNINDRLGAPEHLDSSRPLSPNPRHGPAVGRYSPIGYRGDATRKGSNSEVSWKGKFPALDRSRNPSSSSSISTSQHIEARPALPISPSPISPSFALPRNSSSPEQHQGSDTMLDAKLARARAPRASDAPSAASTVPSFSGDESGDVHWGEMRNYIEVQTEAIVHCIQALLSSIREGAQGNQLHENLTQITTIVSSIIAISKDNIPRAAAAAAAASHGDETRKTHASEAAAAECERILQELSDHCEKLIDMQSVGGSFDKTTKSNMASASYGVAKGLKALNGLLNQSQE